MPMPRSLPAFFDGLHAVLEARPAGDLHGAAHMAFELAGIIGAAGRRLERHLLGPDEVAGAHGVDRQAGLEGDGVHQPLDQIGGLGPPGAAIGVDRQRVGEDAAHPDVHGADRIGARRHQGAEPGDERPVLRQIGAQVADDVDLDGQDPGAAVERRLDAA